MALEVRPQALPLDILFEDETLLVVNKPAGMVTHPAHGALDDTLVNALLAHTGALPGDPLRAGLVHRLDRDTSGLLLVAKTRGGARDARPRDAEALHQTRISRYRRPASRASSTA